MRQLDRSWRTAGCYWTFHLGTKRWSAYRLANSLTRLNRGILAPCVAHYFRYLCERPDSCEVCQHWEDSMRQIRTALFVLLAGIAAIAQNAAPAQPQLTQVPPKPTCNPNNVFTGTDCRDRINLYNQAVQQRTREELQLVRLANLWGDVLRVLQGGPDRPN